MNILIITQMYSQPDDVGDNKPTKTVNYFAKEWAKQGHKVIVMHCPSKFPLPFYYIPNFIKERFAGRISTMVPPVESRRSIHRVENGVEVYRLPMLKMKPGASYSDKTMKRYARIIENTLIKVGFIPELVTGHFANPSVQLVAILSKRYNAKSSIVFHHDCSVDSIIKYRIKENIKSIGAIGVRSIIEAEKVKELLDLKKPPFVCCSGVPDDAICAAEQECIKHDYSKGTSYIYVGSLIKRKHLDAVIQAFKNVSDYNDSLIIIGGGPEEDYLKRLAGNDKRIHFKGRIPRDDVFNEMKASNVFTLISDSETYGMVYIEAMLQGCLTIASKGEGFDGIIKDGVNGFLCEPGNQKQLEKIYKRIRKMTTEERNRIGQAAIDTAIHYSESEVAERYLNDILENQR